MYEITSNLKKSIKNGENKRVCLTGTLGLHIYFKNSKYRKKKTISVL